MAEPGAPGRCVIVTSRNRLAGLVAHDGAQCIRLDVLRDQDAVDLLTTVIGAHRAATEPDAVRKLARLCGRLPLALRIAGGPVAAVPSHPRETPVRRGPRSSRTHHATEVRCNKLCL